MPVFRHLPVICAVTVCAAALAACGHNTTHHRAHTATASARASSTRPTSTTATASSAPAPTAGPKFTRSQFAAYNAALQGTLTASRTSSSCKTVPCLASALANVQRANAKVRRETANLRSRMKPGACRALLARVGSVFGVYSADIGQLRRAVISRSRPAGIAASAKMQAVGQKLNALKPQQPAACVPGE